MFINLDIKKSWFEANKFITEPWEWTVPLNMADIPPEWEWNPAPWTAADPSAGISDFLKNTLNPQLNLGNWWKWSPNNPNA